MGVGAGPLLIGGGAGGIPAPGSESPPKSFIISSGRKTGPDWGQHLYTQRCDTIYLTIK